MQMISVAVALLALAVAAIAGAIMAREAFLAPPPKLVSSLENACKHAADTDCVELVNRCHRGREAEACRALGRLKHMHTKLDNVRRATAPDAGHPSHQAPLHE